MGSLTLGRPHPSEVLTPVRTSPLPRSVFLCSDTVARAFLMSLQLFPSNAPSLLVLPPSLLLRLSVCLLDSYHNSCHVSPNLLLLLSFQEKIGYGEREQGPGWSRDGDMGKGEEGGDKGSSSQLAHPRLSVRTAMWRAGVNNPMV